MSAPTDFDPILRLLADWKTTQKEILDGVTQLNEGCAKMNATLDKMNATLDKIDATTARMAREREPTDMRKYLQRETAP